MKFKTLGSLMAGVGLLFVAASCGGNASAQKAFSLSSLKGSYASSFSGQANTGTQLVPLTGDGVFVSDGLGNLSGHETYTVNTKVCDATVKGTYTVNPDGSGTNAITFTTTTPGCTGGNYTQSLVIANSGDLIVLSNTNGDQVNEQWHLQ